MSAPNNSKPRPAGPDCARAIDRLPVGLLLVALALPAICLNLAARYPPQYSSEYHYDDLAVPLLIAACLPAGVRLWKDRLSRLTFRPRAAILLAICAAALLTIGPSPAREFRKHLPRPVHAAIRFRLMWAHW